MGKTDKVLVAGLVGLVLLGSLCLCCVGGAGFLPYRWFGSVSGPAGVTKTFLLNDPVVLERVGRDPKFDKIPSGSVNENNGVGEATLIFGMKGSKGHGEARVELRKVSGGKWEVRAAELVVGNETIPLKGSVGEPGAGPRPPSPGPEQGQRPAPAKPEAPSPPNPAEGVDA